MAYADLDGDAEAEPDAARNDGNAGDGDTGEIDVASTDLPAFLTEDGPEAAALNGAAAP